MKRVPAALSILGERLKNPKRYARTSYLHIHIRLCEHKRSREARHKHKLHWLPPQWEPETGERKEEEDFWGLLNFEPF